MLKQSIVRKRTVINSIRIREETNLLRVSEKEFTNPKILSSCKMSRNSMKTFTITLSRKVIIMSKLRKILNLSKKKSISCILSNRAQAQVQVQVPKLFHLSNLLTSLLTSPYPSPCLSPCPNPHLNLSPSKSNLGETFGLKTLIALWISLRNTKSVKAILWLFKRMTGTLWTDFKILFMERETMWDTTPMEIWSGVRET